jgi:hypothetical protein
MCRTVAEVVKAADQTDIVSIMYDPDNPFTEEEQACIRELLEPKVLLEDCGLPPFTHCTWYVHACVRGCVCVHVDVLDV